ncbi:hypothetical protein PR003_g29080 [Phytophthora rubi]|uniref:Uncharacterized protein n=1 Tax=Phytophthora rubi TaxID=129364 RepID=A0A6A4BTP9_9STRA|nr:hypothetical protein PR003_g29080 [Phytophthora rubi]
MMLMMSRTVLVVHAQCQNLRIVGIRAVTQEVDSGVLEGHLARQHDHVGASPYETWTEVSEKVYKADGVHDGHEYDSPELPAAVQLLASEEGVFKHVAKPTTSTRAAKLRDARTF